jgi:hypothetical protein
MRSIVENIKSRLFHRQDNEYCTQVIRREVNLNLYLYGSGLQYI